MREVAINNEYMVYPYSIRCNDNCNNISNPFSRVCIPNFIFRNPNSYKCEYRKKAAHLLREKCEEVIDNKTMSIKKYNKTVLIKENNSVNACKPFIASSILFLLVSVILTGLFVYFYVNSQSKRKLQDYYLKREINH